MWPYLWALASFGWFLLLLYAVTHPPRHRAKSGLLLFRYKGKVYMPLTLSVGKTATAQLTEFDAAGVVVPPVTAPVYTSDNTAVATVAGNQVTAVAVGTANITGADPGDSISASDVLTVVDVAASGKLTLTAN